MGFVICASGPGVLTVHGCWVRVSLLGFLRSTVDLFVWAVSCDHVLCVRHVSNCCCCVLSGQQLSDCGNFHTYIMRDSHPFTGA